MYKTSKYTLTDKMSYLICDNYTLLQVMSRFDLSLGFGDKTVQEVCRENGVDCRTFLAVVNFMIEDSNRMEDDVEGYFYAFIDELFKTGTSLFP